MGVKHEFDDSKCAEMTIAVMNLYGIIWIHFFTQSNEQNDMEIKNTVDTVLLQALNEAPRNCLYINGISRKERGWSKKFCYSPKSVENATYKIEIELNVLLHLNFFFVI